MRKYTSLILLLLGQISAIVNSFSQAKNHISQNLKTDLESYFTNPPESAKPGVLWMWMGSNISKSGITKDLEALKKAGFNRTTMFSLSDVCTPWTGEIGKSPTPEIIAWTEPWWKMVRHAAEESKRLNMDFGMFNGPSYGTSGGVWITPELSMQELCWSQSEVIQGKGTTNITLNRPQVDPRGKLLWPILNPENGLVENPIIEARKAYYKDVSVLALPAEGIVKKENVIDLSSKMSPDGKLTCDLPSGNWKIYRFGHTTMGALIQPAQWKATGLECDKMSIEAVNFHMDHVINEIKSHLGDLIGTGFSHVHFDSYEAGLPTWTPKMREDFKSRQGYDMTSYLPIFAGRIINSKQDSTKFKTDFDNTIKDLYRDNYFKIIQKKLHEAKLSFTCEPYGGPWRQDDILPLIDNVMTEFWTPTNLDTFLEPTIASLRKSGQNIVEAEAFTGLPEFSKWDETPASIKRVGDEAFCKGVNKLVLHRFVHQPWDDKFKPGNAMGQWGTHFDRTQTWWNQITGLTKYWHRTQSLLQWGKIAPKVADDFVIDKKYGDIQVRFIHRKNETEDGYFVSNITRNKGNINCTFNINGKQPELWNPVTGEMKMLREFEVIDGKTSINLDFEDSESVFVIFKNKIKPTFPSSIVKKSIQKELLQLSNPWTIQFDSTWGGPAKSVVFDVLQDWTENSNKGIKYYSGTATYKTNFDFKTSPKTDKNSTLYLDLGKVNHLAKVKINNQELGIVWTAPWRISIPSSLLKNKNNHLEIEVTNVWANRLIGDEQEPEDAEWMPGHLWGGNYLKEFPDWFFNSKSRPSKGRYCFTTWNYFTKESPLVKSGLLSPVRIVKECLFR
jgi:hypothetical protein